MRRISLLLAVFLVLATGAPAIGATDPRCPALRCRDVKVPVPAKLKVPDSRVRVLLPSGYTKSKTRYPVLYLLHGVGDSYTRWTRATDLVKFTERYRLIVVMPDGGGGSNAGWYSDWTDKSRHWETFHMKVLVPWVDKNFRTLGSKHRAIAGASMGGFGAMKYAARHRGLFRAAASISGYVDTMFGSPVSGTFYHHAGEGIGGQSLGTPNENVWGSQISDEERWRAHNPTDLARKLKGVSLFIASGMGTPGGASGDDPGKPHGYASEFFVWQTNESFVGALDEANVPYRASFYSGYHDWPYFEKELHRMLPKIFATIR